MEKTVEFYEIYDYYYQPLLQRSYVRYPLLIFSLLFLALIIFFLIRYLRKKQKQKNILPWIWATEKLNQLKLDQCETKSDIKKFYFDLTLIIKEYLNKRFDLDTVDKTDEELIIYLETKNFDDALLETIKNISKEALYIKFANEEALKVQAKKDLDSAYQLVKKTIIVKAK